MAKGTVNKVVLVGRLGMNPEMSATTAGIPVINLNVATNDGYKDKESGNFIDTTEWHKVTIFGNLAEIAGQYLVKGKLVYLEGKLKTNKWQDNDGVDRYTTYIIANEMQLLGGKNDENRSDDKHDGKPSFINQKQKTTFPDDDIPF